MLNSRFIGGLLLIVGTSIGGGMLALPVATAEAGFANSLIFLVLCSALMAAGALLILEVNLRLPAGSNIISMAKLTLGLPGQIIAWVTSLVLLYTLLAGYISGGSDVFVNLLLKVHLKSPNWLVSILFTGTFAIIVYGGIRSVDYLNRGLMFCKLTVYAILLIIISPHIKLSTLTGGSIKAITASLMILITSFGFATIVPSLREYFNDNIPALRKIIILGSVIPLLCYILWNTVIMGTIQRDGPDGLIALTTGPMTSGLMKALTKAVNNGWITGFFDFFTAICMLTAFIAVSIGLFDFLADGCRFKKTGTQGGILLALTFIPPLTVEIINPSIYLSALYYAGICCIILLVLLPAVMAWRIRSAHPHSIRMLPGGYLSLSVITIASLFLLSKAI